MFNSNIQVIIEEAILYSLLFPRIQHFFWEDEICSRKEKSRFLFCESWKLCSGRVKVNSWKLIAKLKIYVLFPNESERNLWNVHHYYIKYQSTEMWVCVCIWFFTNFSVGKNTNQPELSDRILFDSEVLNSSYICLNWVKWSQLHIYNNI